MGGRRVSYASGLSFQNQLMIVGGDRHGVFSFSQLFDEDTGETEILEDMTLFYYYRSQMILVDYDFCQSK